MFRCRFVLVFILSGVIILSIGCLDNSSPSTFPEQDSMKKSAWTDLKLKRIEELYANSLKGDADSIHELIDESRFSDGYYSECIFAHITDLLIKQPKLTMEVLESTDPKIRKNVLWACLASESASPPDNLLTVVGAFKSEKPKIYLEIKHTIEAGSEYMRLYETKGEPEAIEFMKQYFDEIYGHRKGKE